MVLEMEIKEVGKYYELSRGQWKGNTARISNDQELLEKVKQYTWTYDKREHPYLHNGVLKISLHRFVLDHIYGSEYVQKMIDAGNVIEHLDNNGLNCSYDNLHIISDQLNKAKAFTIDTMNGMEDEIKYVPAYITDVYYSHKKKMFQMQIFMNDDIYCNKNNGKAIEMFFCSYDNFEDLFVDWVYLLNSRASRRFKVCTLHAKKIQTTDRPYIKKQPGEENNLIIIRDGVRYLNLDAKNNGELMTFLNHTTMRDFEDKVD